MTQGYEATRASHFSFEPSLYLRKRHVANYTAFLNPLFLGVASARGCTQQFSAEYQCRTTQNSLCYCYVLNAEAPHSVIKLPKNYKMSKIH
jgi:hypothetical protein